MRPVEFSAQTPSENTTIDFFILQAGWHTGIVLRTQDVSPSDWPEITKFQTYKYVDIGWGDERFYQSEGNPRSLAVRAAFLPTSAVLHIVPFNISPLSLYAGESYLKRIEASPEQYANLVRIISSSFIRDEKGEIMTSHFGNPTESFFMAHGKYHLFNTCNTWVVQCLKQSGFDVSPAGVITQKHLITALRKLPGGAWTQK